MSLTNRELWGLIHGMIFGALFLLSFSGGLVALYSLRPEWVTKEGITKNMSKIKGLAWVMAGIVWLTVITGTYIVYPWYRAKPPADATVLIAFPRSFLLADPNLAGWHKLGMEWKEHVAWIAPIAATIVAYVISKYGTQLAKNPKIRNAVAWFFTFAFIVAAIAALLGALITKAAPVR